MGKLVVSLDGVVIKEVQITKDKTTLGRRPYNDMVIDNLAVSGEHAVLQMVGNDVFIEDLNSTNGTYINGKAIKKQLLAQRHRRDRQVQDQVPDRRRRRLREDDDHAAGAAAAQPPAFSRRCRRIPASAHWRQQPGVDQGPAARLGPRGHAQQAWSPPSASPACRWRRSRAGPRVMSSPMSKAVRARWSTARRWRPIGAAAPWRRDRARRHADAVHPAVAARPARVAEVTRPGAVLRPSAPAPHIRTLS